MTRALYLPRHPITLVPGNAHRAVNVNQVDMVKHQHGPFGIAKDGVRGCYYSAIVWPKSIDMIAQTVACRTHRSCETVAIRKLVGDRRDACEVRG